jgi:hypothetical protein
MGDQKKSGDENDSGCFFDYGPGQEVLKKVHNPTKLGVRTEGPDTIERVHVNGNLTIVLRGEVTERINIHRSAAVSLTHSTCPCEDNS